MNKSTKRRFWTIVSIVTLVTLAGVSSLQIDPANALLSDAHMAAVLIRVRNEIAQTSPGQYYEALVLKHADETNRIYQNHREHADEAVDIIQMFIPGLEALVDGKGDSVHITKEQVTRLKAELDWLASVGSSSLRADIETELQRFPLEQFSGMTMSEAWEYVNSNFPSDLIADDAAMEMPQPVAVPSCIYGPDPDCSGKAMLVPDSNGRWAYYVSNGIYFEYPATWRLEEISGNLFLSPTPDSPESKSGDVIYIYEWILLGQQDILYDPLTYPQTELQRPAPIWKRLVSLRDFTGSEVLWMQDTSFIYLSAIFYVPNIPTTVEVRMIFQNEPMDNSLYDPDFVQEQYPNFHHILESLRYWKQ